MAEKVLLSTCCMPSRSVPTYLFENVPPEIASLPTDRRKRARMRVHWPLLFLDDAGPAIKAVTQDLSSDGFYCLAAAPFIPGEIRVCTLTVPAHHPDDVSRVIPVHCRVQVVRVEALAESGMFGVGCRIVDYRVQSPAAPGSESCPGM